MMSSKEKGLILPIFNQQNELLFYVNRPFKEGQPKSKDNGTKATVGFLSRSRCMVDSVVVVEDYISAICVSRVCDCYPLFGSHVSPKLTTMLSKKYDHLVIWLDRDKAKESLRQAARYRPYFKSVRSIMTDLDPKEYNNEQIKEFLK
jgi:hypothetical protein